MAAAYVGGGRALSLATRARDATADAFATAPTTTLAPIQPPVTAPIPWFPKLRDAYDRSMARGVTSQFAGLEMADVRSEHLNIESGVRATWRPPTGACPPPVVWAFGGSAMFGYQQRDEHTIPSELARSAWADGVAIEVVNHAVPGDVAWQALQRMRRALAVTDRPPDVVVSYDGYNDLRAAESARRSGDLQALNDLFLLPAVSELRWVDGRWAAAGDDIPLDRPPTELIPVAAATQYSTAVDAFERDAETHGFAFVAFVQPWAATRHPPRTWPPVDAPTRARADAFRTRLPPTAVDLGGVLDSTSDPVYIDDVHTTERASRIVGQRMWDGIADAVAARAPGDRCPG